MTCKDCIHQTFCGTFTRPMMPDIVNASERLCVDFKNKADFVEVVRCGKCKHGEVAVFSRTIDGEESKACYCNLKGRAIDVDGYCSSGERRDT